MTSELQPAQKSIYETLRDRICLLEYPPGTLLRETDIAKEFSVSRTPVREALQQLAYGGLVTSKSGVGTRVTTPDREEIIDIYEMRMKLAELIGVMSPQSVSNKQTKTITLLRKRVEQLLTTFNTQEYLKVNHEIHFLIGSFIGNQTFLKIWDQLYFQAARVWYSHVLDNPCEVVHSLLLETREVEQALLEGDIIAVGFIQRNFIAYGYRRVLNDINYN